MDGEKPSRKRRSPQETKELSLSRDRRDRYGNNDKAARKAVPRFKAASTRSGRHGANQALTTAGVDYGDQQEARLVQAQDKAERPRKRKSSGAALGEVIASKLNRRIARVGGKAKRAAQRGSQSG